jgi:hypothetical protein
MSANLLEMSRRAEQDFLQSKPSKYWEARIAALPQGPLRAFVKGAGWADFFYFYYGQSIEVTGQH